MIFEHCSMQGSVSPEGKHYCLLRSRISLIYTVTAWKVSKYGGFSGPYFPVFSPNIGNYEAAKTPYLKTFQAVCDVNFIKPIRIKSKPNKRNEKCFTKRGDAFQIVLQLASQNNPPTKTKILAKIYTARENSTKKLPFTHLRLLPLTTTHLQPTSTHLFIHLYSPISHPHPPPLSSTHLPPTATYLKSAKMQPIPVFWNTSLIKSR